MEMMMITLALIAGFTMVIIYKRENKAKERKLAEGITLTGPELVDMGDRAPTFKYNL